MKVNDINRWGSHVPINMSILKTFDIRGVLELGIGLNSTPFFFKYAPYVLAVETDLQWIERMRKSLTEDDNHKIVYHEVPEYIIRKTRRADLDPKDLKKASKFMNSLVNDKLNFLFIDCISSLRYEALTTMYKKFDVITFHDYQPPGITNHYEGGFKPNSDYVMYRDETFIAHTGILIRKELEDKMDQLIQTHIEEVKKHSDRTPVIGKL
jgi:hypothetical protein